MRQPICAIMWACLLALAAATIRPSGAIATPEMFLASTHTPRNATVRKPTSVRYGNHTKTASITRGASVDAIHTTLRWSPLLLPVAQGLGSAAVTVTEHTTVVVTVVEPGNDSPRSSTVCVAAAPPETRVTVDAESAPMSTSKPEPTPSPQPTVAQSPPPAASSADATSTSAPVTDTPSTPRTSTIAMSAPLDVTSVRDLRPSQTPGALHRVPLAGIERINRCRSPLHYYAVWNKHVSSASSPSVELAPGQLHFEPYHVAEGPYAVSEKYAAVPFGFLAGDVPIFQLEYDVAAANPIQMWADMSLIDCGRAGDRMLDDCPAKDGGYLLRFSEGARCQAALCEPESDQTKGCDDAYNRPSDDQAGMVSCRFDQGDIWDHVNMTMVFCPRREDYEGLNV